MEKLTLVDMVLHNKKPYYQPGDEVNGVCLLNVTEKTKMKGFTITLFGSSVAVKNDGPLLKPKVGVDANGRNISNTFAERSIESETYVNQEYDVSDPKYGLFGDYLLEGNLVVPFRFKLPSSFWVDTWSPDSVIPISFEDNYCLTHFLIRAEILRARSVPNISKEVSLPVLAPSFSPDAETLMNPVTNNAKSEYLSLLAALSKQTFTSGDSVDVKCYIGNLTDNIVTLKVEIRERKSCVALCGSKGIWRVGRVVSLCRQKHREKVVATVETSLRIRVPKSIKTLRTSRLINDEYLIRVTLEMNGFPKNNIFVELPIFVGNIPEPEPVGDIETALTTSTPVEMGEKSKNANRTSYSCSTQM